jgi:hypothetical protein
VVLDRVWWYCTRFSEEWQIGVSRGQSVIAQRQIHRRGGITHEVVKEEPTVVDHCVRDPDTSYPEVEVL